MITLSIRAPGELRHQPVKELDGSLVDGIEWAARTYALGSRQLGDLLCTQHTRIAEVGELFVEETERCAGQLSARPKSAETTLGSRRRALCDFEGLPEPPNFLRL